MRAIRLLGGAVLLLAVCAPAAAAPTPQPLGVVPGVAFQGADGSVTFAGTGFTPRSPIQISVNGTAHSTLSSTDSGGFAAVLHLEGVGTQALAAAGKRPDGSTHLVIASVHTGRTRPLPAGTASESIGAGRVYGALGLGLGSVAVTVLALLAFRLHRRHGVAS